MANLNSILKSILLCLQGLYSQNYGFSNSHVWMWELDNKKGWALKNWCLWNIMLEKTLESPLDKGMKPVNPKGNQYWMFIGRTDAEAEAYFDHRMQRDAGKDWRQEEKVMTEDEMVGWYHWLNRDKFEPILGDVERQGSLVCCSPWGHKESDKTERLNKNNYSQKKNISIKLTGVVSEEKKIIFFGWRDTGEIYWLNNGNVWSCY